MPGIVILRYANVTQVCWVEIYVFGQCYFPISPTINVISLFDRYFYTDDFKSFKC